MCDNCDAHCCCSVFVMNIRLILIAPKAVIVALVIVVQNNFNDGILIGARHERLQISILYKPENSVISLSANLCSERLFLT